MTATETGDKPHDTLTHDALAAAGWHDVDGATVQPRPLEDVLAEAHRFAFVVRHREPDEDNPHLLEVTWPDLPGLSTTAATWDTLGAEAREAAEDYLADLWELGWPLPVPTDWQPDYLLWENNWHQMADERQRAAREATGAPAIPPGHLADGRRNPELTRPRFTAAELADSLGMTPNRVNQIARELGRGTMVAGAKWFSADDRAAIRDRPDGRRKTGGLRLRQPGEPPTARELVPEAVAAIDRVNAEADRLLGSIEDATTSGRGVPPTLPDERPDVDRERRTAPKRRATG